MWELAAIAIYIAPTSTSSDFFDVAMDIHPLKLNHAAATSSYLWQPLPDRCSIPCAFLLLPIMHHLSCTLMDSVILLQVKDKILHVTRCYWMSRLLDRTFGDEHYIWYKRRGTNLQGIHCSPKNHALTIITRCRIHFYPLLSQPPPPLSLLLICFWVLLTSWFLLAQYHLHPWTLKVPEFYPLHYPSPPPLTLVSSQQLASPAQAVNTISIDVYKQSVCTCRWEVDTASCRSVARTNRKTYTYTMRIFDLATYIHNHRLSILNVAMPPRSQTQYLEEDPQKNSS